MKGGETMPQPAKSARLQLLKGNPNKKNIEELERRAKNEEKLKMASDKIEAPKWLDSVGKSTFEFIQKELMSIELVSNPDVHSMALYCSWYSQYVALTKQLKKMKLDFKKEYEELKEMNEGNLPAGTPKELYGNPLSKQMDTCSKNMRMFGSDLGLSPSARAKLAIKLTSDEDDDDDF